MQNIKLFIDLTRLSKPIGFMLLFWPCTWGLTIAYDFSGEKINLVHKVLVNNKGNIDNQTDSYEYRLHCYSTYVSSNSSDNGRV